MVVKNSSTTRTASDSTIYARKIQTMKNTDNKRQSPAIALLDKMPDITSLLEPGAGCNRKEDGSFDCLWRAEYNSEASECLLELVP